MKKWCINSAAKYYAIHWVEHNAIYGAPNCQSSQKRFAMIRGHIMWGTQKHIGGLEGIFFWFSGKKPPLNCRLWTSKYYRLCKSFWCENERIKTFYTISFQLPFAVQTSHASFTHFYQLNHQSFGLFSINFPYHKHRFSFCFSGCPLEMILSPFKKKLEMFFKKITLKNFSEKDLFEKDLFKRRPFWLSLSKTIRTQFHTTWLLPARTLASDRAPPNTMSAFLSAWIVNCIQWIRAV